MHVDEHIAVLSTYLGHVSPADTYWYLSAAPELMELAAERLAAALRSTAMTALAPALQAYFTDRLIGQRAASPNTIAAYRDTFRLLLALRRPANRQAAQRARHRRARRAADRRVPGPPRDTTAATASATRNNRLAAIHSLFGYLALQHPEHAASIQRVLAIPPKRTERNLVTYLTEPEVDALLAACDQTTWTGRRDHAMLALTIQTGLRISELAALDPPGRHAHRRRQRAHRRQGTQGDGERRWSRRPERSSRPGSTERAGAPDDPLFPTTTGKRLSRDAIERRLAHHVAIAATSCPSITTKHVTMHTLRHTAAMRLLLAGNDITVIALWLGHEQISTTNDLPARRHDPQATSDRPHHDRSPPNPAATGPPTRSSPSSRASDYADTRRRETALSRAFSPTSA